MKTRRSAPLRWRLSVLRAETSSREAPPLAITTQVPSATCVLRANLMMVKTSGSGGLVDRLRLIGLPNDQLSAMYGGEVKGRAKLTAYAARATLKLT